MGHNHEECGDRLWEEKDKQYGTWMLAQRKDVQYAASGPAMGARPFMRGRGRGGFGAGGRGGNASASTKRSSGNADLDKMDVTQDTEEARSIRGGEREDNEDLMPSAKKNLNLTDAAMSVAAVNATNALSGKEIVPVSGKGVPPLLPIYVSPRRDLEYAQTSSAASLEEDHRVQ